MFRTIVHLRAYQGFPLSKELAFDEPDPQSPLYTRPLAITGRTLVARVMARPKTKAFELKILKDPPAPGLYKFKLIYMGVEYPFEIALLPGEGAKELQQKIISAINDLIAKNGWQGVFAACAPSCADAYEIVIAGLWPGVDFDLEIVEQPPGDPPDDQIELDPLQDNIPLAEFEVSSLVVDDKLVITLKLSAKVTGGLPAAGDGPYMWALSAPLTGDEENDVLLLARGHLVVERT